MAATLSQLSLVQTQMQASYQLIAALSGLSLVKFLPVGMMKIATRFHRPLTQRRQDDVMPAKTREHA